MAFERKLRALGPITFTADGASNGLVTISSTVKFKVKSSVVITATSLPDLVLEVKRVLSSTTLLVGPAGNILTRSNVSLYTVALGATIFQPEQDRPGIPTEQHQRAAFEEEPTLATRNVLVDPLGEFYSKENPLPIGVEVVLDNVTINTKIDAFAAIPDSSLSVGTEDGTKDGIKHVVKIDSELKLRVKDEDSIAILENIADTLSNPQTIVQPLITAGTKDGTLGGELFININNIKQQILASDDRQQLLTYADFGTKNQRITKIEYISATFLGITASKVITYTLVGNKYKRDSINWIII